MRWLKSKVFNEEEGIQREQDLIIKRAINKVAAVRDQEHQEVMADLQRQYAAGELDEQAVERIDAARAEWDQQFGNVSDTMGFWQEAILEMKRRYSDAKYWSRPQLEDPDVQKLLPWPGYPDKNKGGGNDPVNSEGFTVPESFASFMRDEY